MKKVAIVTAAVLALGLAACTNNNAENTAANETVVENTASTDVNVATDNAGAEANILFDQTTYRARRHARALIIQN